MSRFRHSRMTLRLLLALAISYALALAPLAGSAPRAAESLAAADLCLHSGAPAVSGLPAGVPHDGSGGDCCSLACRLAASTPTALAPSVELPLPAVTEGARLEAASGHRPAGIAAPSAFARGPPLVA